MTTPPAHTAPSSVFLPSGRVVSVGDLLTVDEARDVIIHQRGTEPLRPMPLGADRYEVALSDSMPARLVVAELFAAAPALIVNGLQRVIASINFVGEFSDSRLSSQQRSPVLTVRFAGEALL